MGVSNAVGVWGFQNRANDLSAHLDELKKTLYERGRALGVRPKSAVPIEVSTGMLVRERVVMGVGFDGRVGGDVGRSSMNRARVCCVSLLQCRVEQVVGYESVGDNMKRGRRVWCCQVSKEFQTMRWSGWKTGISSTTKVRGRGEWAAVTVVCAPCLYVRHVVIWSEYE